MKTGIFSIFEKFKHHFSDDNKQSSSVLKQYNETTAFDNTVLQRQIRIFISSTFQDMQDDRNYLINNVFPDLQVIAEHRDVSIVPLDLRWGITAEEVHSGKVLEICLQEIEQSRPFFIGLIGNRYGWCPSKEELQKNSYLKNRWGDWLERDIETGLSITEIEMQYGALRAREPIFAQFYIKQYSDSNPEENGDEKLQRLKQTVRENRRYPVYDYYSKEDLGKIVKKNFLDGFCDQNGKKERKNCEGLFVLEEE